MPLVFTESDTDLCTSHNIVQTSTGSFEAEHAVEIKYDAIRREYTVICACLEEPSDFRNHGKKSLSSWTIHSVVIIDAIRHRETMHSDLTGRMSCTGIAHGWTCQTGRTEVRFPSVPFPAQKKTSELDKRQSMSWLTLGSVSEGRKHGLRQQQFSVCRNITHNSITPKASGRTRRTSFITLSV